jgi:hypothetical protein
MHIIYDYRFAPNSFDFATFLANAYIYSRAKKTTISRVTLVEFSYRPERAWDDAVVPDTYHERKVESVAFTLARMLSDRPAIELIRDAESFRTHDNEITFPHNFNPTAFPKNQTSTVSLLPCSESQTNSLYADTKILPYPFSLDSDFATEVYNKWGPRYVTLTIRNSGFNSRRNDLAQLISAFRKPLQLMLERAGIRLVLIPDRENIDPRDTANSFDGYDVDLEAAFSLRRRFSLYAGAELNITPATGPNILMVFSPYPYFMYGVYDPSVPVMTKDFFNRKGPIFGKQRPWATSKQITDWTPRSSFDPISALKKIQSALES